MSNLQLVGNYIFFSAVCSKFQFISIFQSYSCSKVLVALTQSVSIGLQSEVLCCSMPWTNAVPSLLPVSQCCGCPPLIFQPNECSSFWLTKDALEIAWDQSPVSLLQVAQRMAASWGHLQTPSTLGPETFWTAGVLYQILAHPKASDLS